MVRLPGAENSRSRDAMVILVESIPQQISSLAQLVCDYHRAGANIPRSRLWRTERHPATPLVIEYAGVPGGAKAARGWLRREQGHAWRLWTFEAEQWAMRVEVTLRDHGDWVALLKPPLIELYRSCLAPAITMRRPPEVAGKLIHMIETELALVAPGDGDRGSPPSVGAVERACVLMRVIDQGTATAWSGPGTPPVTTR